MKRMLFTWLLVAASLHGSFAQRVGGAPAQAAPGGGDASAQVVPGGGGGGTPAPPEYEAPITGFADALNAVFQSVDKSRVPSGLLEEYGLQFIDHTPFTGTNGFTTAKPAGAIAWFPLTLFPSRS